MEVTSFITSHAQKRFKERVGIKNLDQMIRMTKLALERGIKANESKEYFTKSIKKHLKNDTTEVVLYNGSYYIFSIGYEALITVISAEPRTRRKEENFNRKSNGKRIENRKYLDFNYYLEQVDFAMAI